MKKQQVNSLNNMIKKFFILFFCVSFSFFLTGCNIFSIFNFGWGYNSLLDKAESAYEAGDYEKAADLYEQAIEVNPRGSKARAGFVNAYSKVRMVDFLWLAQKLNSTISITNILNRPRIRENVLGPDGLFQKAIDILKPVVDGKCDSAISPYDIAVNLQIGLSYFLRGVVLLADSNNDGYLSTESDIIRLNEKGFPYLNEKALNVEEIEQALMNSGVSSNQGLGAVFSSTSDPLSLTNLQCGTNGTYYHYLKAWHDTVEACLLVFKLISRNFYYFSESYDSIYRVSQPYEGKEIIGIGNFLKKLFDLKAKIDSYEVKIDEYASTFNNFHKQITGVYAYSGKVKDFVKTPIESHLPPVVTDPPSPLYVMYYSTGSLGTNVYSITNLLNSNAFEREFLDLIR